MSITVCTVSGKGGTGKSTVSSGLAIAAALLEKKVLLIDLDSGLRCLDIILGIDEKTVFDLSDALAAGDLKKSAYTAANYKNISLVPAPALPDKIDFPKLAGLIKQVEKEYDFVILDFPAGADFDGYNVFKKAAFLIVSGADGVSTRDASVISRGIISDKPPRLIINRFDSDLIKYGVYENVDGIIDGSATRLIGIVPADSELLLLSKTHKLKPKGRALKSLSRIIRRISGENVPLPDLKRI